LAPDVTLFLLKAVLSGLIVAAVATVARRNPGFGALIGALPLISVMSMVWLWAETKDVGRMRAYAGSTFWYVLPSLPMFLLIPALLRAGVPFYLALGAGCALTIGLFAGLSWVAPRLGISL
jgi:hypothetical protein